MSDARQGSSVQIRVGVSSCLSLDREGTKTTRTADAYPPPPPPPAQTQGTRPAPGHLRARAFRHILASTLGRRPSPPLGPRGTMCWSGGPTVAGTKINVPSEWMGNKRSAPVRGRSGLGGGAPRHAIWTPGRPRGTKLCGRAAGQEGQTQTAPPHQVRPSQEVGTVRPAPRPAGPASPALRALVMSCQSPRGPCGDITSEVSPAAAVPHPDPLTSEENHAPPHGHRSGSLPAWASLRVPMPHPILCLSVPPSIPPSAQRPPHHTLRDAPLRAKGWRGARQPRLGGSVPDWPAQRACGRRDLGRDTPPGPTAAQALVPRVEGRGSRIEDRESKIEDRGSRTEARAGPLQLYRSGTFHRPSSWERTKGSGSVEQVGAQASAFLTWDTLTIPGQSPPGALPTHCFHSQRNSHPPACPV